MSPIVPRRPARPLLVLALAGLLLAGAPAPALAGGKPGYPTTVTWGGQTWQIKTSRSAVGPGPNVFSASNVSVDGSGTLHLRITRSGSTWTCAEIIGPTSYGYGTYTFTLASSVDALDPNVVLGLFTWSDKARYAHREIDIEVARWGNAADPTNAQFVIQPASGSGHLDRFTMDGSAPSIQSFTWQPGQISWLSRDTAGHTIASYTYTGSDVPTPGDERVRLNLWLFNGQAPTDGQAVDVAVTSFTFTK